MRNYVKILNKRISLLTVIYLHTGLGSIGIKFVVMWISSMSNFNYSIKMEVARMLCGSPSNTDSSMQI